MNTKQEISDTQKQLESCLKNQALNILQRIKRLHWSLRTAFSAISNSEYELIYVLNSFY